MYLNKNDLFEATWGTRRGWQLEQWFCLERSEKEDERWKEVSAIFVARYISIRYPENA
jgi:hypothetical protein